MWNILRSKGALLFWGLVISIILTLFLLAGGFIWTQNTTNSPSFVSFVTSVFLQTPGEPNKFFLFIGRFHPLVLHLPIGMLVLTFILQVFSIWKKRQDLYFFYAFCLGCTFIFSIVAVIFGTFLSMSNDYAPEIINRHGWGGILFSFLVGMAFYFEWKFIKNGSENKPTHKISIAFMFIALNIMSIVGHDGGSLTHGENYLFKYAPEWVRKLTGRKIDSSKSLNFESSVYSQLISTIFEKNCIECHGETKAKGKIRLDDFKYIIQKNEGNKLIVPGNADDSLIYKLITTDNEDDAMPPEGKISKEQRETIKWWINSSKDNLDLFERKMKDVEVPKTFNR